MAEPGLLRRIYNPRERVHARSESPNLSGPATMLAWDSMKKKIFVEKQKFDAVLGQLLKAKPVPMKKIKTTGKRPKGTMFPTRSES